MEPTINQFKSLYLQPSNALDGGKAIGFNGNNSKNTKEEKLGQNKKYIDDQVIISGKETKKSKKKFDFKNTALIGTAITGIVSFGVIFASVCKGKGAKLGLEMKSDTGVNTLKLRKVTTKKTSKINKPSSSKKNKITNNNNNKMINEINTSPSSEAEVQEKIISKTNSSNNDNNNITNNNDNNKMTNEINTSPSSEKEGINDIKKEIDDLIKDYNDGQYINIDDIDKFNDFLDNESTSLNKKTINKLKKDLKAMKKNIINNNFYNLIKKINSNNYDINNMDNR